MRYHVLAASLLAVCVVVAGVLFQRSSVSEPAITGPQRLRPHAQETPAPPDATPSSEPLITANDAIARALAMFPSEHQPHSPIARFVAGATYVEWSGYEPEPAPDVIPKWIVGILGNGLLDAHSASYFGIYDDGSLSTPIDGLFFAFDPAGRLYGIGALAAPNERSYAALAALPTIEPPY